MPRDGAACRNGRRKLRKIDGTKITSSEVDPPHKKPTMIIPATKGAVEESVYDLLDAQQALETTPPEPCEAVSMRGLRLDLDKWNDDTCKRIDDASGQLANYYTDQQLPPDVATFLQQQSQEDVAGRRKRGRSNKSNKSNRVVCSDPVRPPVPLRCGPRWPGSPSFELALSKFGLPLPWTQPDYYATCADQDVPLEYLQSLENPELSEQLSDELKEQLQEELSEILSQFEFTAFAWYTKDRLDYGPHVYITLQAENETSGAICTYDIPEDKSVEDYLVSEVYKLLGA